MSDRLERALLELAAAIREELAGATQAVPTERLYDLRAAADALGVGRTTLHAEMDAGRLRSVRVGHRRKSECGMTSERIGERFVFMPLRFRREHRDWTDAEAAAWLDLYLASYEIEGRFDSLEVARAYLVARSGALDALIQREAFAELEDGSWALLDYLSVYDGRQPRHHKSMDEHLADTEASIARGEPLTGVQRWARWKARRQGGILPDPRRTLAIVGKEEKEKDKEEEGANVRQTFANEPATPEGANGHRLCPVCTSPIVAKKGKLGPFLSCSRYPECTYSEDLPAPPPKPFVPDYDAIREAHGGRLPPGMVDPEEGRPAS